MLKKLTNTKETNVKDNNVPMGSNLGCVQYNAAAKMYVPVDEINLKIIEHLKNIKPLFVRCSTSPNSVKVVFQLRAKVTNNSRSH